MIRRPEHSREAGATMSDSTTSDSTTSDSSMASTVTRDDAGGVATLTLQRPALSHALRTDLLATVEAVGADDSVRAVLLTGTGRAFCVGQALGEHLEELRSNAATSLNVVVEEYNPLILALAALRVPV